MRFLELQNCKRTKAKTCQCSDVGKISEDTEKPVVAVCQLEHSDTVKGTIFCPLSKHIPYNIKNKSVLSNPPDTTTPIVPSVGTNLLLSAILF